MPLDPLLQKGVSVAPTSLRSPLPFCNSWTHHWQLLCQPGPGQSGSDLHCIGASLMLTACQSFCLVLCPRVTIVLAEQQGENTCTRCHSLAHALHPRLRDWTPALSLSCSPCHCYSLPRGPARGAGHYKRRDVARVRPPSTRNPEEVSVGTLPSFRRFRTDTRILSGAAVSTRTQPSARLTAVGRVDRWAGFLMALEMSHSAHL